MSILSDPQHKETGVYTCDQILFITSFEGRHIYNISTCNKCKCLQAEIVHESYFI